MPTTRHVAANGINDVDMPSSQQPIGTPDPAHIPFGPTEGSRVHVVEGYYVCYLLQSLRGDQRWASRCSCLVLLLVAMLAVMVTAAVIRLVVGPGPHMHVAHVAGLLAFVVAVKHQWFSVLKLWHTRLFHSEGAPKCPECDAALVADATYRCSCCETSHKSTLSVHWSSACSSCGVKPDSVMCWRCRSVIRLHSTADLKAISLLDPPVR